MFLHRQSVESGHIEHVRRGPAVQSVPHICRDSLLSGERDRVGDEALLDWVVDLRKAHHRHVHTTLRHRSPGDFRHLARIRVVGIEMVFGCGLTRHSVPHTSPRGDDQRTVRADKRVAESLDGASILLTNCHEVREVVIEGTVDDAL